MKIPRAERHRRAAENDRAAAAQQDAANDGAHGVPRRSLVHWAAIDSKLTC